MTFVCVNGCKSRCPNHCLFGRKWNVLKRLPIAKSLRQAEIYNVDAARTSVQAHQEIVWLDISVDEISLGGLMEHFEARDELNKEKKRCLQ